MSLFFLFVLFFGFFRGIHSGAVTLQTCGISEGSIVAFTLSSFTEETPLDETFYINDVVPSVQQSQKGISVFLSSLYAVAVSCFIFNTLSYICPMVLLSYEHELYLFMPSLSSSLVIVSWKTCSYTQDNIDKCTHKFTWSLYIQSPAIGEPQKFLHK